MWYSSNVSGCGTIWLHISNIWGGYGCAGHTEDNTSPEKLRGHLFVLWLEAEFFSHASQSHGDAGLGEVLLAASRPLLFNPHGNKSLFLRG